MTVTNEAAAGTPRGRDVMGQEGAAREIGDYDLIVVGGGVGGGALSTVMARAGRKVLLLEQTETYVDRVRGEWIAPWGVAETRTLGLYDSLMAAGGHHLHLHRHGGGVPLSLRPQAVQHSGRPRSGLATRYSGC
jgi:2-polyprenyl-6-methoxyphenol hydroxylase-like FAD-dependent oxidoreductase